MHLLNCDFFRLKIHHTTTMAAIKSYFFVDFVVRRTEHNIAKIKIYHLVSELLTM